MVTYSEVLVQKTEMELEGFQYGVKFRMRKLDGVDALRYFGEKEKS